MGGTAVYERRRFHGRKYAWQVLHRHMLVASLLTYSLRPSSLQLFWDHLYSTEGTTTSVSKNAVLLGYHHSQYGFHLCGVFLSMHNYPPFRRRYYLVLFRIYDHLKLSKLILESNSAIKILSAFINRKSHHSVQKYPFLKPNFQMYSNFPPFSSLLRMFVLILRLAKKRSFNSKWAQKKGIFLNTVRMFQFKIHLDRSVISSFQTLLIL